MAPGYTVDQIRAWQPPRRRRGKGEGVNLMKTITIEMPETVLPGFTTTPEEFAREFRRAAAIEWYREGRVSQGKGAEIAGLNRWEFIQALGRAEVPACQVSADELNEEVERALASRRERLAAHPPEQDRAD
jgi:predicted HTH domain antitoxin